MMLVWNGTSAELVELQSIIGRVCAEGRAICNTHGYAKCGAHTLLVKSQRQLDDLIFARRIAKRLLEEEFR